MQQVLIKAKVRAHVRRTKGGKVVQVREHQDSREKREAADRKYLSSVARTIQHQIGHQALYMIGAKQFIIGHTKEKDPYLQFRIGRNSEGVHIVKVILNQMDTYDVEFSAVRKDYKHVILSSEKGIYHDMLVGAIQRKTGMSTSMGTMGKSKVRAHLRHTKGGKIVPVREYDVSHAGGHYVTTHLDLKGRGIKQSGDGSDHARGLKTYHITDAAFKKVQQEHGEFHYNRRGESLTRGEQARKDAGLAEKNAASQQAADIKAINALKEQRKRLGDNQKAKRKLLQTRRARKPKAANEPSSGHKKMYRSQDNIGSSKYSVSFHNGKSTHNDGSPFFDIRLFKNKKKRDAFIAELKSKGYGPQYEYTSQKAMEGAPMSDLSKYPALQKAVEVGKLSKSLEFNKTGTEIYNGIMAKLGACQGELQRMIAKWKAGVKPTSDDVGEAANGAEPEREPWEIRSKRREIDKLERIGRNLDLKKKYKLSEYDLSEYGL